VEAVEPLNVFPKLADSVPYSPKPRRGPGRPPKPKRSHPGWHYLSEDESPIKASASYLPLTLESPSGSESKYGEDSDSGAGLRRSSRSKWAFSKGGKRPESPEELTPNKRTRSTRTAAASRSRSRATVEGISGFDGAASDPDKDSSYDAQNPDGVPKDQFLVFDPDAVRKFHLHIPSPSPKENLTKFPDSRK